MSKIELQRVSKHFSVRREAIAALEEIDLRAEEGEFVSIVGPSGCGKSTIIRIVGDIIKPTSGQVTVDGYLYDNKNPVGKDLIRKMGFVFQTPNLYPWYTVKQNIELPLEIFGLKGKEWNDYADFLLYKAGLMDNAGQYPGSLSQGMSQRAGVIRAMVHKPEILLMDEPFGALDEKSRERMNLELLDIWSDSKLTVVFITHNISEAVLLSQRIYVMAINPGRIVDQLKIDLPSRDLSVMSDPKFAEYCRHIDSSIGSLRLENAI